MKSSPNELVDLHRFGALLGGVEDVGPGLGRQGAPEAEPAWCVQERSKCYHGKFRRVFTSWWLGVGDPGEADELCTSGGFPGPKKSH